MSSFKDSAGREWTLDVNVGTATLVHKETGVSLYKILDDKCKPLAELLSDLPVLATVCYLLSDAQSKGVTQESFALALKGDAIQNMANTFMEALTDFFPDARIRAALKVMQESGEKVRNTILDRMTEEVKAKAATIKPEEMSEDELATMTTPQESLISG